MSVLDIEDADKVVCAARSSTGVEVEAGKNYAWCTCGRSKNQPFCDGSHRGTSFTPLRLTFPESKKVFLCRCKATKNPPYCDGTHRSLPPEIVEGSLYKLPLEVDANKNNGSEGDSSLLSKSRL
mmetsp:Transcript_49392/g.97317  ORF Transcript_49392/g.97317 Transcript_49392/m.97317 type:complete len:124 (-) Transcript_49392:226-597(-)